jgi:hypothetical protein
MPAWLIPIAGLALGALGRLIANRRAQSALSDAQATGNAPTPSETSGTGNAAPPQTVGEAASSEGAQQTPATESPQQGGDSSSGTATIGLVSPPVPLDPATGPPQQNQTTPSQGDAGLASRLGEQSVRESRRKNREQQASLSQDAVAR